MKIEPEGTWLIADDRVPGREPGGAHARFLKHLAHMRHAAPVMATLGLVLAAGAPFMLGGASVLAELRRVPPHAALLLALALVAVAVISALAKAGKLQILLRGLGQRPHFGRIVAITLTTDFAFLVSPAGAAGYGVNIALLRRAGVSWSMATTVVGADQALDLVFFAVAVPIAAVFALRPLLHGWPLLSAVPYGVTLLAALVVGCALWYARDRVMAMARVLVNAVPWLRARRLRLGAFQADVGAQAAVLLRGPRGWRGALLLLTALQWLLRYGALWFILLELGHRLSFGFVLVLQAVILHIALWTGVPAGGGGADFGLAAAAAPWVARPVMATALLLWRFATLYCPLLLGVCGMAALSRAKSVEAAD